MTTTETVVHEATIAVVPGATTTGITPAGAAAAGAAVAMSEAEEDTTDWGWVAFGILAAAVLVGGLVLLLRRRHEGPKQA